MAKKQSKSKKVALKTLDEGMQYLVNNEGEALGRDVIDHIGATVEFNEWESGRYEKTGYIRWQSIMHFYTIDLVKAGFLRKSKGVWTLTPEGEEVYQQGIEVMLDEAIKRYRAWKEQQDKDSSSAEESNDEAQESSSLRLEKYEEEAVADIQAYIKTLTPYEFQDLCGTLLRAMGYYIPHIAPKGKDGGIDLIAYSDPLGTRPPRIKVQVKHKPETAISVDVIRQLVAVLNKEGDVGLFITSGRFTSESERYARESHKHVELIDFARLIELWQQFYDNMTDQEKDQLPLQPVYFLGSVSK